MLIARSSDCHYLQLITNNYTITLCQLSILANIYKDDVDRRRQFIKTLYDGCPQARCVVFDQSVALLIVSRLLLTATVPVNHRKWFLLGVQLHRPERPAPLPVELEDVSVEFPVEEARKGDRN